MSSHQQRTALITGCSDGGLSSALALERKFHIHTSEAGVHAAGIKVYASARSPSKLSQCSAAGIETFTLDVLSTGSIQAAVSKLNSLDILINNAGAEFLMLVADVNIADAKEIFDLNVWSYLEMTQAFLPFLIKSSHGGLIAAIAMLCDTMRLELSVFSITVVDLKSGVVHSNFINNHKAANSPNIPDKSFYSLARDVINNALSRDGFVDGGMPRLYWAKAVVGDLLKKNPPPVIWRGEQAWLVRLSTMLPFGMFDSTLKKVTGLEDVEKIMRAQEKGE